MKKIGIPVEGNFRHGSLNESMSCSHLVHVNLFVKQMFEFGLYFIFSDKMYTGLHKNVKLFINKSAFWANCRENVIFHVLIKLELQASHDLIYTSFIFAKLSWKRQFAVVDIR